LIWANTTALNDATSQPGAKSAEPTDASQADAGKLMLQVDLKAKSNARVDARNEIAAKLMQSENIPIDDLHSLVLGHPELYHGDVHFNARGTALEATQVAAEIEKVLGK
jgi:lysophospholipase L1-like esterase